MTMTLFEALRHATATLEAASVPDARRQAAWLLEFVLNKNQACLIANHSEELEASQERYYFDLVSERSQGKPIQYLLGCQEFRGMELEVTSAVLIPRPETELVVEEALACLEGPDPVVVDVGTGSGCIAISIAKALPGARVLAVDLSEEALAVARKNAARLETPGIEFFKGDLLAPLNRLGLAGKVDCVASNPPYVADAELESLPREVRDWEPHLALFAGPYGLAVYEKLIPQAAEILKPQGWFVTEIGYNMRDAVCSLFDARWRVARVREDANQIPRVLVAQRTNN